MNWRFGSCVLGWFCLIASAYGLPREHVIPLSESLHTGNHYAFALEGDRLYAATDYGLEVLDVSDLRRHRLLGRAPTEFNCISIAVKDSVAFAADFDGGLYAFDARDPGSIREVFRYLPDGQPGRYYMMGIALQSDRLYLLMNPHGVRVYDVSRALQPRYIGSFTGVREPYDIAFRDTLSYLLDGRTNELVIADLYGDDPFRVLRRIPVQNVRYINRVAVGESTLFIAAGSDGLIVYDLSDPHSPQRSDDIHWERRLYEVSALGDYVYVAAGSYGLLVVDATDPNDARIVHTEDTLYYYHSPVFRETIGFFPGGWDWGVYDVTDPAVPELFTYTRNPRSVLDFAVQNHHIYLPRYEEGLVILSAQDPARPEPVDTLSGYHFMRACAAGGWLYAAVAAEDDTSGLLVPYEIRSPTVLIAGEPAPLQTPYGKWRASGERLLECDYGRPVRVWDVSWPEAPSPLASIEGAYRAADMQGDRVYAATIDHALEVWDISSPDEPSRVGRYNEFSYVWDVAVRGNILYGAQGFEGLVVMDVGEPARIRHLFTAPTVDYAYGLTLADTLLYLSDYYGGLQVYDLHNPGLPELAGYYNSPGIAFSAQVEAGICYLADVHDLTICRFDPLTGASPAPSIPEAFTLAPPYPNPFNSAARLSFKLPRAGEISISAFDPAGRRVAVLAQGRFKAGSHSLVWQAAGLPSGSYTIRLKTPTGVLSKPVVIIR